MCGLLRHCAAGLAVLLVMGLLAQPSGKGLKLFGQSTAEGGTTSVVDRANKGDRLPVAAVAREQDRVISAVEVVGLRDAAVVYRDRDDHILFRTDPLANATVVARGVVLPQVTIRDVPRAPTGSATASSVVEIKPVSPSAAPGVKIDREKKIPEGCDPAFSPLAESARANNFTTRCLAAITPATRFAAAVSRG